MPALGYALSNKRCKCAEAIAEVKQLLLYKSRQNIENIYDDYHMDTKMDIIRAEDNLCYNSFYSS